MDELQQEGELRREFTGKLDGFDSKEEKAEHQKGLKIYRQGITIFEKQWPSRAERRKQKKK